MASGGESRWTVGRPFGVRELVDVMTVALVGKTPSES
jgi:hypothetical protein